jgi:hypothetical protein
MDHAGRPVQQEDDNQFEPVFPVLAVDQKKPILAVALGNKLCLYDQR